MHSEHPAWAEELRRRYLRGEASQFIVHGNIFDRVVRGGKLVPVSTYLAQMLGESKSTVFVYNVSVGGKLVKAETKAPALDAALLSREPDKVLPAVERMLRTADRFACILEYAETIAPAADTNFLSDSDRGSVVSLHRWSLAPEFESSDNIIVLIAENLAELHPKLVSNPKIATIKVEIPDEAARRRVIELCSPDADAAWVTRLAAVTAGLKAIQIESILRPAEAADDVSDRQAFIARLLGPGSEERASKLAHITGGMDRDEIRKLVAPEASAELVARSQQSERDEVDRLIAARKREILERECFGLIEFVEPKHDFSVVGGVDPIKEELLRIARAIREGRTSRVPMGLLFTGPMGTGKTFIAEAFACESGLTTIKLKNFRSKWVGSTEGNLEKILSVIQAIGQVLVIIDEGDRAFGNGEGDGDGGTSSRVIARIKEFMSDTRNRGRILFILMTNRPDRLDIDIKRAGRLDRKIPFFYPQTPEQVEAVIAAQLRRHRVASALEFPRDREVAAAPLIGLSNADIEATLLLAAEYASEAVIGAEPPTDASSGAPVDAAAMARAVRDYLPARDTRMLEFMELLAVFEASNRRMLPPRYAEMSAEELQARLDVLKLEIGARR